MAGTETLAELTKVFREVLDTPDLSLKPETVASDVP